MRHIQKSALIICMLISMGMIITSPATAAEDNKHFPPLSLNNDMVQKVVAMARDVALPDTNYEDGTKVGKESKEERAKALLPNAFEAKIVNHAVFWTTVHWCKLNMSNMGPTLRELTDRKDLNKRQTVFIPVLHGTTHALVREQLLDLGTCTEEFREYIIANHKDALTPAR